MDGLLDIDGEIAGLSLRAGTLTISKNSAVFFANNTNPVLVVEIFGNVDNSGSIFGSGLIEGSLINRGLIQPVDAANIRRVLAV